MSAKRQLAGKTAALAHRTRMPRVDNGNYPPLNVANYLVSDGNFLGISHFEWIGCIFARPPSTVFYRAELAAFVASPRRRIERIYRRA